MSAPRLSNYAGGVSPRALISRITPSTIINAPTINPSLLDLPPMLVAPRKINPAIISAAPDQLDLLDICHSADGWGLTGSQSGSKRMSPITDSQHKFIARWLTHRVSLQIPQTELRLTIDMEEGGRWLEARVGPTGFRADIATRQHRMSADEPEAVGGTDAGPTPYEFLLAALASCTAMTIQLYARRKSWPLESATVFVRHGRSHEKDCEMCETQKVGIGVIEKRIELEGALTDEQRKKLLDISDRCPIRQTLARGIEVTS